MVFKEYDTSYELVKEMAVGGIKSLNILEDYLDFAIHRTIRKQMPDLSDSDEKFWAIKIFTKYLNDDTNVFTSTDNIRANLNMVSSRKIYQMLIKDAIEYMAYKEKVSIENDVSGDDFLLSYITNKMYFDEYDEVRHLITGEIKYKTALINNYITYKYGSPQKERMSMYALDGSSEKCRQALENLELNIKSISVKG